MDPLLRFLFPSRHELVELLDGDRLFFYEGGDGGGGGSGGSGEDDPGAQGGDGGGAPGGDDDPGAQGGDGGQETLTPEQARKLRSENKNLRERAKAAEQKAKELEDADLKEGERLKRDLDERTKRAEELEREHRTLKVRLAAVEVGILPNATAAAAALVNWDDVDVDDDKAVADALKALKREHAYLFAADTAGGKKPPAGGADGGRKGAGDTTSSSSRPGTGRLRNAYATKD